MIGPLLLVLRVANWARLWVLRRRILTWVLRTELLLCLGLMGLLRIAVRGRSLVLWPRTRVSVVPSSASACVCTTTSSVLVWRVLSVTVCRWGRSWGRRRWAVGVGHIDSPVFVPCDVFVSFRSRDGDEPVVCLLWQRPYGVRV